MKMLQPNSLAVLKPEAVLRGPQRRSHGRLGTKARDTQRMRVWRQNPRCGACGGIVPFEAMELDHILPLHLGGGTDDGNTQVMHPECHRLKTNQEVSDSWQRWRAGGYAHIY